MTEGVSTGHLETARQAFGHLSGPTVIGRITVRKESNHTRVVETRIRESWHIARTRVDVIQRQRQGIKLRLSWCAEERRQTRTTIFRRHFRLPIDAILREQVNATCADVAEFH